VTACRGAREPLDADPLTVTVRASYDAAGQLAGSVGPLLSRGQVVVVVLTAPGTVDLAVLDALARLALHARRARCELRLRPDSDDVRALAALTGLSGALPLGGPSGQP
jgi:hypothetical protein